MKATIILFLIIMSIFLAACDNSDPTSTTVLPAPTTPPNATATAPHPTESSAATVAMPATPSALSTTISQVTPSATITATLLEGFPAGVSELAWSPDSALLATATGGAGADANVAGTNSIWVWHADGTLAGKWTGHAGMVTRLAWSPDGTLLASGDIKGNVIFWGIDGTQQKTLHPNTGTVFGLDWSPDGQKLAIGSVQSPTDNTAQIWTRDGTLEKTMHTKYSGGKFYNLEWSPDGKYLAGGATDYALWDSAGNVITTTSSCPSCTPAWGMGWSPDSKLWATGDESGYVAVYNTAGKRTARMNTAVGAQVIAWSPDGTVMAISSEIWRPDGTQIGTLPGLGTSTQTLDWSPGGTMFAAGNYRGIVGVFDPDRKQLYRFDMSVSGLSVAVNKLAWSPDGKTLAVGFSNNVVRLWRVVDRKSYVMRHTSCVIRRPSLRMTYHASYTLSAM